MRIIANKLKNFTKEVEWDVFQDKAVKGRIGGKTVSDLLTLIVNNTKGQPDTKELRKSLDKGNHYFLYPIDTKLLKIQDADIVKRENKSFKGNKSTTPIVIDDNYNVIDGRHRAVATSGKIQAYVPARLYYNLVRGE